MNKLIKEILITFTEDLLGSASGNKEIHEEFIASKAETTTMSKEETEAIPLNEKLEKASTIFPRDRDGGLILWDYQIRGTLKSAIESLIDLGEVTEVSKYSYKKAVDKLLFVKPRKIPILDVMGNQYKDAKGWLERPLRADTMKGERIALARSEVLPAGTQIKVIIELFLSSNKKSKVKIEPESLIKALDYGEYSGVGQWRSGGYGRYKWEEIPSEVKAT